jgi:hypothetical protein
MPRALAREGVGLERALHEREIHEIQRHAFFFEHARDHRQVRLGPLEAFLHEVAQAALEELDVLKHLGVERDRDVVWRALEIRGHGLACRRRRRGPIDRSQREQFVDCSRLGLRLGDAGATANAGQLDRRDPIDERGQRPRQPRVASRAFGHADEDVDGAVEMIAGGFELALPPGQTPGFELRFGSGQDAGEPILHERHFGAGGPRKRPHRQRLRRRRRRGRGSGRRR